jgi:hypothetical protein
VNLTLTSQDGLPHQFFVDYNNNSIIDSGEPHSVSFFGTIVFSFTVDTLGNFTYRCAVHPLTMFGDFKVWNPIPEFPGLIVVPVFVVLTLLAVVLFRRKRLA